MRSEEEEMDELGGAGSERGGRVGAGKGVEFGKGAPTPEGGNAELGGVVGSSIELPSKAGASSPFDCIQTVCRIGAEVAWTVAGVCQ